MQGNYEYFQKGIIVTGKHADYVDDMWVQGKIEKSYFRRLLDLYTTAATVGLRAKRKVSVDNSTDNKRTVQLEQVNTKLADFKIIIRLMLLLDNSDNLTKEQLVNRAFRNPQTEEELKHNMDIFYSYLRGGIEILHEELVERTLTFHDNYTDRRVGNMVAFFSYFDYDSNEDIEM